MDNMNNYCLGDIYWIYTNDGRIVHPYRFYNLQLTLIQKLNSNLVNSYKFWGSAPTNIQELNGHFVYELSGDDKDPQDKVKKIFEKLTKVSSDELNIGGFYDLQNNGILQFKGFNSLFYKKFIQNKDPYWEVTDSDIATFSDIIATTLAKRHKKASNLEIAHNTTSNF